MAKKQPIPAFCRGTVESLTKAISKGGRFYGFDRVLWCYITEGDHVGELAFVMPPDGDNEAVIRYITGDNVCNVVYVDELPSPQEAVTSAIYVYDNKGYHYTGTEYVKLFDQDMVNILQETVTEDINNLQNAFDELQTEVVDLSSTVGTFNNRILDVESSVEQHDSAIEAIQSAVAIHASAISDLSTTVSTLEEHVSTNSSDIAALQVFSAEASESISELESDMANVKDSIEMNFIF